ncbi:hypothetical protein D9V29_12415 [Mycetocola manganoxydans]|uniref:Uncharacterized protein n=1 Tax=Mycetocola manganoxydans TaxID=699879 RepID=A0A3L6ZM24_9MICO|nr:hypothetical protein D9V29_12415 [Mycetocola manganoxydans]
MYPHLRRAGKTPAKTIADLGFTTSRVLVSEADVGRVTDRRHAEQRLGAVLSAAQQRRVERATRIGS